MRARIDMRPEGPQGLRDIMRSLPRPSAVVRCEGHGIVIELSDGRVCTLPRELCRNTDQALAAAVQWARRHGAAAVEVCD
jgi:hypothetical protein